LEDINSGKDVLGQELQSENLSPRSEKCRWQNYSRQYPEIPHHFIWPPQNDTRMSPSGIGTRAYQNTYKNNLQQQIELHSIFNIPPSQQFALVIR
jgi:hypothetical protein